MATFYNFQLKTFGYSCIYGCFDLDYSTEIEAEQAEAAHDCEHRQFPAKQGAVVPHTLEPYRDAVFEYRQVWCDDCARVFLNEKDHAEMLVKRVAS